jgi:hypothetical protein
MTFPFITLLFCAKAIWATNMETIKGRSFFTGGKRNDLYNLQHLRSLSWRGFNDSALFIAPAFFC